MLLSAKNIFMFIIAGIIIIFLQYFSLKLIPGESKLVTPLIFGSGISLIGIFLYNSLFQKGIKYNKLDFVILLFFVNMIISAAMANMYWGQSFFSSLVGYRFFYIYFLYFVLIFLKMGSEDAEKLVKVFFFLSIAVFLIDVVTFPNPLFAYRDEERRGGMTIFFFGQGFTFLGGFYYLDRFIHKKKVLYLLYFLLSAICLFALTQSRMNLIALAAGALLILLMGNWKYKYLISALFVVASFVIYNSLSFFENFKDANENEIQYYQENVRVEAQHYFLAELQAGVPTILFGNGFPAKDGRLTDKYENAKLLGLFTSDVGLTGFYSYFGVFGVIIWILLFLAAFRLKNNGNSGYLKAYFLTLLTSAFTGYSIFEPGYMPATVLALFLIRCQMESNDTDSINIEDKGLINFQS